MALVVALAILLLTGGRYRVVARRLTCPVRGREATVRFLVEAEDGDVYREVAGCSLVAPGETVCCGQVCRSLSVAPFATRT